jgi:histidinol-phosphatase (PHP family)
MNPELVSVHGGHSGQFCGHANDSLAEVVQAYINKGFLWVCLTEHMATLRERFIPDEERVAQLNLNDLASRFKTYFSEARRLAALHADSIQIYVGFETEGYSGFREDVSTLKKRFQPDMLVGSIHHVNDIPFDAGDHYYRMAIETAGGIEQLYCDYFDLQLKLINELLPEVVGHFDLIRIFDPNYKKRWDVPDIWNRAVRNLERIAELDLILDFNVRALAKGQPEPYVSAPLLDVAYDLGIKVVPGDDSHGASTVGQHLERGIEILQGKGFSTDWPRPINPAS